MYGQPTADQRPGPAEIGRRTHDGFYLRLGLGGGLLIANFETEDSQFAMGQAEGTLIGGGAGFDVAIGGTIAPGLVLAGALIISGASNSTTDDLTINGQNALPANSEVEFEQMAFTFIGPFADYYFDPNDGWHLQAGVGLGGFSMDEGRAGDVVVIEESNGGGLAATLGFGYEWWIADQWSLGALARVGYGWMSGNDDSDEINVGQRMIALPYLMFGATYH